MNISLTSYSGSHVTIGTWVLSKLLRFVGFDSDCDIVGSEPCLAIPFYVLFVSRGSRLT